jgi:hypothetical protein
MQMLVGQPPFVDDDPLKVYQQVSGYFLYSYFYDSYTSERFICLLEFCAASGACECLALVGVVCRVWHC